MSSSEIIIFVPPASWTRAFAASISSSVTSFLEVLIFLQACACRSISRKESSGAASSAPALAVFLCRLPFCSSYDSPFWVLFRVRVGPRVAVSVFGFDDAAPDLCAELRATFDPEPPAAAPAA